MDTPDYIVSQYIYVLSLFLSSTFRQHMLVFVQYMYWCRLTVNCIMPVKYYLDCRSGPSSAPISE